MFIILYLSIYLLVWILHSSIIIMLCFGIIILWLLSSLWTCFCYFVYGVVQHCSCLVLLQPSTSWRVNPRARSSCGTRTRSLGRLVLPLRLPRLPLTWRPGSVTLPTSWCDTSSSSPPLGASDSRAAATSPSSVSEQSAQPLTQLPDSCNTG